VGFNNRTRGFSDEFRYGAEIGVTLKKFTPILKINSVESFFNGDAEAVQNGIFSNNTEYFSPTAEVNYQWTGHLGLSLSGGFACRAATSWPPPTGVPACTGSCKPFILSVY
jgi:hypothetical protein